MEITEYTLDNGARIILAPQADARSATTLIMYPVGSRNEPEKLSGVSHYIEHLMFKGTQKRKNTLTLTREIDRLGADYNAFTSKEYTGYYIKAGAEYVHTSLDILSDMLFHSVFDAKEMEREKGPIVEELRMYKDNPIMRIGDLIEELLYVGPMGRDIGGTVKHVKGYKRDDVLNYRDKYYGPNNMTVVIAGKIPEDIQTLLGTYIGTEKARPLPAQKFKPAEFGSAKKQDRIRVEHKDVEQSQLMMAWPAFPYGDKRNAALSVLNTILGGSMSSRLFIKVRERLGLAYTVRADEERYRDTGYTYVRAGLEPKNVNKAIAVIVKEIDRLKEKGITKRELADAKMHLRGAMTLSLENSSTVANWYANEALFYDKIESPEEWLAEIDAVIAEDVLHVAKQIFKPNQLRVAIVGNVDVAAIKF